MSRFSWALIPPLQVLVNQVLLSCTYSWIFMWFGRTLVLVKLNRAGEVKCFAGLQLLIPNSLHSWGSLLSLLTERPHWSSGNWIFGCWVFSKVPDVVRLLKYFELLVSGGVCFCLVRRIECCFVHFQCILGVLGWWISMFALFDLF